MGNEDSKIKNRLQQKNHHKNRFKSSEHSQEQEAEDQKPQIKQGFQSLDEIHRRILNIAIASALKRMESDQQVKAEQEEKKIISSLNRYYLQNKFVITSVHAQNMTETDYETIIRILRKHHFFNELLGMMNIQKDFVTMFLFSIKKKTFKFKQYIYKQFDPPSNFYIIAEGKLFIELNSMGLKPLSKNDYFGLQSIIYDSEQGESIKVKSSTAILYEISKEQIMKVHQKISLKSKQQIQQLLEEKVIFFNFLDHKEKERVLERTVKSTYSKGEIIFEKDYDSNAFFIIKKGNVLIKIPQKKDLILEAGSSFGQSSFNLNKVQRQGKAMANQNNTIIYGIGSRTILKSLGNKLDCAVLQNSEKWALYRDISINQLYFIYKFNMQKLLSRFKLKKCEKYQVLGRKGELASKIFLNVRCEINFTKQMKVFNSNYVKKLVKQYEDQKQKQSLNMKEENNKQTHQEQSNKEEQKEQGLQDLVYNQDIIVTQKGSYSEASLENVVQLIIQAIEYPQKQRSEKFRVDLSVANIQKYAKLSSKYGITTILGVQKNFNMQIIVKIYHKTNNNNTILTESSIQTVSSKYYKSSSSIHQNQVLKKMMKQKQIISKLHHPNFCGFYKIQENQNNYYLLIQYIKGVTLSQVHQELGIMPQVLIKFYTLSLAFMLDYLHKKQIIYRNLRSQKILIDNNGFPNLFDFKSSKNVNEINNHRTSTLIQTPHYCSPQAIDKKSYSFETDFWQLGVLLYQMIYKMLPFGEDTQNPIEIYSQILKKQPNLKKINSRSALTGLLQKKPQNRIKTFRQLTKQPYFQNFDYETIQNEKMIPPYVPKNPTKRFKNLQVFLKKEHS